MSERIERSNVIPFKEKDNYADVAADAISNITAYIASRPDFGIGAGDVEQTTEELLKGADTVETLRRILESYLRVEDLAELDKRELVGYLAAAYAYTRLTKSQKESSNAPLQ